MSSKWADLAAAHGDWIRRSKASTKRIASRTGLCIDDAAVLARYARTGLLPDGLPRNPETSDTGHPAASGEPSERDAGEEFFFKGSYIIDRDGGYITFVRGVEPIRTSRERHEYICQRYSNMVGRGATVNELAREIGMPRPWLVGYLNAHGITHDKEPFSAEQLIEKTAEELVQDTYQLKRLEFWRAWQSESAKRDAEDAEKWRRFEMAVLSPLVATVATREVPEVPILDIPDAAPGARYCGVLSASDWHWGKGSSADETGSTYNREVLRARAFKALAHIADRVKRYGRPEKIYVPIGSDFFHVDTEKATTTSGTPQDMDCTPADMAVSGCEFMEEFLLTVAQIAPVECVLMSGNHDRLLGVMLLTYLRAAMRGVERVTVHAERTPRTYQVYGRNLLGFAHGDGVSKTRDLAGHMAREMPEAWGRCPYREIYTGHLHYERAETDEAFGVRRVQFPSISGTDRWHSQNGFVGSRKAVALYLLGYDDGPQGQFYGLA